ncbi:MAG: acetoin utilization protein AcuC [Candidatus Thorarchaeota archaeon]|nr:MAG: acetoin utilization protein AcuC [Candidatus Thorarchaeota archaeon]
MKGKLVYPYTEALLNYQFSRDHPLKQERLKLTYELSKELGLLKKVREISPTIAARSDLELFHTPDFIDAVMACHDETCVDIRYGLGTTDNPVFANVYDAAARYVGATLDAVKEMLKGATNAFVISGGLHHAQRSQASGFCIFNDVAVSLLYLLKKKPCKILYFDFDAHHADGVQNAFYRSKQVLTISVHQTGKTLFPGTGFVHETGAGEGVGYSVNVPLLPGGGSAELVRVLEEIVVPLFESYKPNLLVTQLGVDGHYLDPLAHLSYTSHGYEAVIRKMKSLSSSMCDLGWLAVGGGGYNVINVARLWTLFLSIMLDEKVPVNIPEDFLQACTDDERANAPTTMRDEQEAIHTEIPRETIALDLERTLRRVKELVFPYHGLA